MTILILKITHIFGFVAWFAGLFYLVRMFVYHTEAYDNDNPRRDILREQYHLMEKRAYTIICNPAIVITWMAGIGMIVAYGMDWLKYNHWLHVKLLLLLGLTYYHWYCGKIIDKLKEAKTSFSSTGFRLFNEVPTLFLVLIASLAVLKNSVNYGILILSIIGIGIVLFLLTKLYKRLRDANSQN